MLRSLLTGVSGAKAHQKRLDVVGNNIANVNTVGFKKSTVVFQDLLSQTERGAMAPDGNVGGVNAKQVGLGVQVGAIETIHTQGTISQTGNRTDMAIQGEGYYVVKNGAENLYTRAGDFVLDSNSDLATSGTGYRVQGNEVTVDEDGVVSTSSELSDINIPIGRKMEAKATSTVGYRCNLDSRVDPYLPLGIPDGVKFSSEILGSEYTISVAEGEDVSDFINIRLENEADGSVETLRFSFEGVQQSSHDESTYYPKLELVGSSGHTVNYDAAKGELSIDGTSIPMSAYMNYQAVSIEDSTGTTHTYLAEITEIGNKAQVRLWGEGKNETTGASQVDYFQWNVLKTEDGLFDPDSTLKMTTGEDSEFPDPISLFLEIDSSGKALNFRGNVSPIIGPATSNSGVSKAGDTKVNVGINQTYSKTYNQATLDFNYDQTFTGTVDTPAEDYTLNVKTSMPSGPYDVGDIIPLTLETSGVLDGSEKSSVRQTVNIRYAGVNATGQGVFQYDNAGTWTDLNGAGDIDVGLKGYSVNDGADTWVNNDDYFLA
ncbi:MAG: flagellar hook-basal body complex protein, partial [Synergistota bacterium]|nr:flagellar hook-basal body complex protein [Synergistota bacterium]